MKNEKSTIETKLSYLLIGGGIGAILALLFAPKAGDELRSDIANATRSGIAKTEDLASHLSETAQNVYADSKTKVGEIYDSARQKVNSATTAIAEIPGNVQNAVHQKVEQASAVIEAGRIEYDRENGFQDDKTKGKTN